MTAMRIRRLLLPLAGSWLMLCGCASAPPPKDPELELARAEALVAAGSWNEGIEVLGTLAGNTCPKRLRDRRDLAAATAQMGLGEPWTAFELLEPFPDLYPHSELRPNVVEMIWQTARTLAVRNGGFLFFWSDRNASQTVLEHLVTRHPDTPRLADALRLLGDMAYEDGDYEVAQQRFRDLMLNRPESEWTVYAQFRFAMAIVDSLQGPDYDLDRMAHAVRELDGFLATKPESPQKVQQAEQARARLLEWQVERHLRIADFYERVGNLAGRRHHLDIAASNEFASTAAHGKAAAARDALERSLAEASAKGSDR
ncbi:MAG TPA: outer membrane protein assembly factor BamD [Planctomycetota bacterium]